MSQLKDSWNPISRLLETRYEHMHALEATLADESVERAQLELNALFDIYEAKLRDMGFASERGLRKRKVERALARIERAGPVSEEDKATASEWLSSFDEMTPEK